jgi:membrane protease subunit (stomatin/prohibitin family)
VIENISLPPEIEKALDAAAAQSARGVDNTMAWEGMQAMRDAAKQPGGGNGVMQAGMGMGMGMGMGNMMGNVMAGAMPGYPQQGYPPGYPPPGYPPPQGYPQQQQQQQGPPPAPAEDNSLESKLRKLKAALDAGLLTEDEYKTKRTKLLDAF